MERADAAAGSRSSTGWAGQLGLLGRGQPGHRPRRSRSRLRAGRDVHERLGSQQRRRPEVERPRPHLAHLAAALQVRREHARPQHGRAAGHRSQPEPDPLPRRPQRQRPVAQRSTTARRGAASTSFPALGTYSQDPSDPSGYGSDPLGVVWVVFDPRTGSRHRSTQTIYVGVADLGLSIYRSTDGGATWAPLPGQPVVPAFMPHHAVLASTGKLYVTYNNQGGPYDGSMGDVWKYDTATGVWTKITPDPSSSTNSWFGYGGIAVDAQNPDTLVVAELNRWWPDVNLWRSTDGGATWRAMWDWGPWPTRIFQLRPRHLGRALAHVRREPGAARGQPQARLDGGRHRDRSLQLGPHAVRHGRDHLRHRRPHELGRGHAGERSPSRRRAWRRRRCRTSSALRKARPCSARSATSGASVTTTSPSCPPTMYTNPVMGTATSLDYAELQPERDLPGRPGPVAVRGLLDGRRDDLDAGGIVSRRRRGRHRRLRRRRAASSGARRTPPSTSRPTTAAPGRASGGIPCGRARRVRPREPARGSTASRAESSIAATTRGATLPGDRGRRAPGRRAGAVQGRARPRRPGLAGRRQRGGRVRPLVLAATPARPSASCATSRRRTRSASASRRTGTARPPCTRARRSEACAASSGPTTRGRRWVRVNDDEHQYAWTGSAITGDPRVYGRVYVSTNGRGVVYGEPERHSRHDHDDDCDRDDRDDRGQNR